MAWITTSGGRVIYETPGELEGADLSGLKLNGAQLAEMCLQRTNFTDALLNGATLSSADLSDAVLVRTNLQGVICDDTVFNRANLSGADLYWATAFNTSFRGSILIGASFRGAALKGADFSGADLTNGDFSHDNLGGATQVQGAIFTDAVMVNIRFDGAEYDERTVFPAGFNPKKTSMVFVPFTF